METETWRWVGPPAPAPRRRTGSRPGSSRTTSREQAAAQAARGLTAGHDLETFGEAVRVAADADATLALPGDVRRSGQWPSAVVARHCDRLLRGHAGLETSGAQDDEIPVYQRLDRLQGRA